ncbi:hypothetical protein JCM11957_06290 [Caminibacter profundus]
MKEVFKYTFTCIAEWKKFLFVVLVFSIFTLLEPFPFIGITAIILEKLLYLSIGVFLIYILKRSLDEKEYFSNLEKNGFATFMFHFIPSAAGILIGFFIIGAFWLMFFILILQYTDSLFILANPHNFVTAISSSPFITQVVLGFYSIYLIFFSFIFLGKLGEALEKENFKGAFISIITSLIDFKYWIKTFSIKYFIIYLIWSAAILIIYSLTSIAYIILIYPTIINNPNISLIIIPILVATTTILTYFTFFSAYFAHKTTKD